MPENRQIIAWFYLITHKRGLREDYIADYTQIFPHVELAHAYARYLAGRNLCEVMYEIDTKHTKYKRYFFREEE